jgi:hypothetical protein
MLTFIIPTQSKMLIQTSRFPPIAFLVFHSVFSVERFQPVPKRFRKRDIVELLSEAYRTSRHVCGNKVFM